MTPPLPVWIALGGFAGSVAWMAVLVKRHAGPWMRSVLSTFLDNCADAVK